MSDSPSLTFKSCPFSSWKQNIHFVIVFIMKDLLLPLTYIPLLSLRHFTKTLCISFIYQGPLICVLQVNYNAKMQQDCKIEMCSLLLSYSIWLSHLSSHTLFIPSCIPPSHSLEPPVNWVFFVELAECLTFRCDSSHWGQPCIFSGCSTIQHTELFHRLRSRSHSMLIR